MRTSKGRAVCSRNLLGTALMCCAVALVLAGQAQCATTWHVPFPFFTIQSAINAASPGDTIQVGGGTYDEHLVWQTKSLQLLGAGAGLSIVDGNAAGSCLRMTSVPATSRIQGFTFTNGSTSGAWPVHSGGGVYCENSSPMVINNTISGNTATNYGGGIRGSQGRRGSTAGERCGCRRGGQPGHDAAAPRGVARRK